MAWDILMLLRWETNVAGMGDINVAGQRYIDVAVFWLMDYIW